MHEVDAHPQAVQVLRLFHEVWHDHSQPFTTTGVPLATRPDWREIHPDPFSMRGWWAACAR